LPVTALAALGHAAGGHPYALSVSGNMSFVSFVSASAGLARRSMTSFARDCEGHLSQGIMGFRFLGRSLCGGRSVSSLCLLL
jgi:hypothetical protein